MSQRSPVASAADRGGFFRYHGVWAPGVRLFRRLRFVSKAAVILAMLMIPIAVLLTMHVGTARHSLDEVRRERDGTRHLEAFAPLTAHLIRTRNATRATLGGLDVQQDYAEGRRRADEAFERFDALLGSGGDPLAVRADFEKLRAAWRETASSKSGLDASGKSTVFVPVTEAAVALLQTVQDGSGLSLDPELDSFYLALALSQSMPQLIEDLGQIRAWSAYVAAKGEGLSAGDRAQTHRRYAVWDANVRRGIAELRNSFGRVSRANADAGAAIDAKVLDRVEAFRARAYKAVYDGSGEPGAALWRAGGEVFDALETAWRADLPVLDGLLRAREDAVRASLTAGLAAVVLGLIAAAYLCVAFYKVMDGGLREVERHLVAMTDGDLTTTPRPWGRDEAARLMLTLARMQDSLRGIVATVRASATTISHESDTLARSASDVAHRAERSAATLEETAASMEEIAATTRNTADAARRASDLARASADVAGDGGQVVGKVVETMRGIDGASRRIEQIVGAIDGIAFQTNILALNAAVEAARAGEQGRGFAVVASEVRALAQRSADAAREVKALIRDSVAQIGTGVTIVGDAGKTMEDIVTRAAELSELVEGIARAAAEQQAGVGQVDAGVQDLDRVAQENAGQVEQTALAARALQERAVELAAQVERFRLPQAAVA
ncbi:MAG: methyl-accepting chemotaxis protein [Burkholderiales bacterium]